MSNFTAAILGLTHPHAQLHLRSLQECERVSRVVLWDPDAAPAKTFAGDNDRKIAGSYTDLAALLEKERPLFAFATMRNDLNAEVCVQALRAGVHVLSEKPIAVSAAEVQRVVEAAERSGCKLGVVYQNRWLPIVQEARRLVREGVLGRLTSCEARVVTSQVRYRDPKHWLFDRDKSGGGILSWLGCHSLDCLRYVTGDEVASVSAITATLGGAPINVEDVASVSMQFRSGAIGSLQAGYQLPISQSGYTGAAYDSYLAFRGTEGVMHWRSSEKPLVLHVQSVHPGFNAAPARQIQYEPANSPAYGGVAGVQFLGTFIDAALGQGDCPASGNDALRVARIVEAAYESNRTGRRVDL